MKSAFITNLLDAHLVADEHFTGVSNPDFGQELRKLLPGSGFEVSAE